MAQEATQIPEGHITLKEASRISGYAPDYVGQLIRKGKIYGRQVYFNVAWVTTEEAVQEYLAREKSAKPDAGNGPTELVQRFENVFLSESRLSEAFKISLYGLLGATVLLSFLLMYAITANIERSLDRGAAERILQNEELVR